MASTISRAAAKDKKRKNSTDSSYDSGFVGSRSGSVRTDWSNESAVRTFRKRTIRQEHPFRAEKVEHELARKGVKASDSDLEERLQEGARRPKRKNMAEPVKKRSKQPRRTSSLSADPEEYTGDVIARTWVSQVTKAYIPVTLSMTTTSDLFDKMEQAWRSKLDGRSIDDCIVSFSWLDEDNNIFLLRGDDGTAYGEIMKEARRGLAANDKQGTINIHISA